MLTRTRATALLAAALIAGSAARTSAEEELPGFADAITKVVEKVEASVVNIKAVAHGRAQAPLFYDPYQDQFFYGRPNNVMPQRQGEGSGFIFDAAGLILTNAHVVEGADELTVTLSTGQRMAAKVVGTDPSHDLAVLKVADKGFRGFAENQVARLGDSTNLKVGSWAVAIGSPFSLSKTVTVGIISALGRHLQIDREREYFNLIQTDAAINPGNSGGPLMNLKGEVIAINTAINPAGQGLGFAIPINLAKKVSQDLVAHGTVTRTWLGIELGEVSQAMAKQLGLDRPFGVYLARVIKGGPADRVGLEAGDVILRVRGKDLEDPRVLIEQVQETGLGNQIELEVMRQDGTRRTVSPEVAAYGATGPGGEKPDEPGPRGGGTRFAELGIRGQTLGSMRIKPAGTPPGLEGVLVLEVERGSPAEKLGLEPGDVIQKLGRVPTPKASDLREALQSGQLERGASVTVFRDGYWHFLAQEE